MNKPLLIDIMLDGRFVQQLRYDRRGFPEMIDGEFVESHRREDIEAFVYEKRPSLKGKPIKIEIASQKVFIK